MTNTLTFYVLGEHFFGVDGDEDAAAAGQDFVFFVEDFGGVDVGASFLFYFAAFDAQRFVQRDGLEIFDSHFTGEGDDVMQLVDLAHGVVEDAGDDAAVAVAGRSGVATAEAEAAHEGLALFVKDELEAHAIGIVHAADEAVVLLHLHVAGVVALGLRFGHGGILQGIGFELISDVGRIPPLDFAQGRFSPCVPPDSE
jgi:hypothetical protein